MDARGTRTALWERYESGHLSADELEARLLLVDRATDDTALATALDGPVPFRRRGAVRRARTAALMGVGLVALLVAVVGAVVVGGGDDGGNATAPDGFVRVGGFAQGGIIVGKPVPVPIAPPAVEPPDGRECGTTGSSGATEDVGDDLVFGDRILSDPPAVVDGYDAGQDFEVGAESDPLWQLTGGDIAPVRTWGRVLTATDGSGATVELRGYAYDSAASAAKVTSQGSSVLMCPSNGVAVAVASFTGGPHRIVVAAKEPDLASAREHAAAALAAEQAAHRPTG